ncbi:hypothetical protein OGAPHI_005554 [Ogataea philodendri]|uniref:Uncharacterized protein n=1 Tax=Ogataea philodendri TaxID=1378263 RepID=A0A9P8NZF9_9ASCO|nr:uncharacterized protein OGAPHI_005554 [Ogataea philodendri]KAH3662304.1 hypothetical protein OGAPHI_005554 [Ogataea philodendri]
MYPGKSTRDRSGTLGDLIVSWIGSLETASASGTAMLSSKSTFWTCWKSVRLNILSAGNSAVSAANELSFTKVSSIGRLVTILDPLGRNSLPTIDSSTEDLPLLCDPITTIDGNLSALDPPILSKMLRISIICRVRLSIASSVLSWTFSSSSSSSSSS